MIYVCIPATTKPRRGASPLEVRQVFAGFPREYQLLVLDDGSTTRRPRCWSVHPCASPHHHSSSERRGYAASVEALLRRAVELTDRPKRDAAILMHADFAHNTQTSPISSGGSRAAPTWSSPRRAPRRAGAKPVLASALRATVAPWRHLGAGVVDLVSGFSIIRLVALRNAIRSQPGRSWSGRMGRQRRALLARRRYARPSRR